MSSRYYLVSFFFFFLSRRVLGFVLLTIPFFFNIAGLFVSIEVFVSVGEGEGRGAKLGGL